MTKPRKSHYFSKPLVYVFLAFLVAGSLPLYLEVFFGLHFIPSRNWAHSVGGWSANLGWPVGLALAVLFFFRFQGDTRRIGLSHGHFAIITFLLPFIVSVVSDVFATRTIPMIDATFFGAPIEHVYSVKKLGHHSRFCKSSVLVRDMPPGLGSLCGIPSAVRGRLVPGMEITVSGRGTANGVFYDTISLKDY